MGDASSEATFVCSLSHRDQCYSCEQYRVTLLLPYTIKTDFTLPQKKRKRFERSKQGQNLRSADYVCDIYWAVYVESLVFHTHNIWVIVWTRNVYIIWHFEYSWPLKPNLFGLYFVKYILKCYHFTFQMITFSLIKAKSLKNCCYSS